MALDFIKIDPTSSRGTSLRNAISVLRQAEELLQRELDVMNHNQNGTDWTAIEALYGLAVGKGQPVFTLLNGTVGAFNGTFQNNSAVLITSQLG